MVPNERVCTPHSARVCDGTYMCIAMVWKQTSQVGPRENGRGFMATPVSGGDSLGQ